MSTFVFRVFLISLGLLLASSTLAAPGDREFKQGIDAFKAGQYDKAVVLFEKAQRKGKKSSALLYNLGVSYYKTSRYAKSEQAFTQLLSDKQFQQLAQYNLGLVNLAQQRKQIALDWFTKAADKHGDPKITALANHMLDKYAPQKSPQRISGLVSLGYGYNSNVTLVATGSPSQQSDHYTELFGFITMPVGPVKLNASLFSQDFSTVNSSDFMQLSAGVAYPFHTSGWMLAPALYLAKDELNSNDFLTITDIRFEANKSLISYGELQLRYRYSDIHADNAAYSYLEGGRQQFRVQDTNLTAVGQLRLRYELELNDRQNLPTANYSPTRNTLLARLKQKVGNNWQAKEEVSWRDSQYPEAAGVSRHDTRYQLDLSVDRRLGKDWRAGLSYNYTDNKSNVASETYNQNDVQAYVNWLF